MNSNMRLDGKVALVTGGARGIGRSIAGALAEAGAIVLINYNGSAQKAAETVEEIKTMGGTAKAYACDVSDYGSCEKMINEILEEYGRVDILVNNAGITRDNLLMRMSTADFEKVLDVNLKGTFHTMKLLTRQFLKQRSGRIINISSVSGVIGNAGQANYAASKAGIIGLTKSIARELGSRGICVNAVAPGFIETQMTEAMPGEILENAKKSIPLGRIGRPEEVAGMVRFLASDMAGYITGQVICVDGGMSM